MNILESSQNYRELATLDDARAYVAANANGWLDPGMPQRQYNLVVERELALYLSGHPIAPYDVLIKLLSMRALEPTATLLDVGASSGYYSKVLSARDVPYHYTGLDFNPHYAEFAARQFGISDFIVADAADMYMVKDASYDIVITGGMLMHTLNYARVIQEIQRVARQQIVYHRTPVNANSPTSYFAKEAYGLECLEIHFNEDEIVDLFCVNGWTFVGSKAVTWEETTQSGHVSYLFRRMP